jgi:hypothetical protein
MIPCYRRVLIFAQSSFAPLTLLSAVWARFGILNRTKVASPRAILRRAVWLRLSLAISQATAA